MPRLPVGPQTIPRLPAANGLGMLLNHVKNTLIHVECSSIKRDRLILKSAAQRKVIIVFKQLADGRLSYVIEGATPGKEVSKLVEINFKKM